MSDIRTILDTKNIQDGSLKSVDVAKLSAGQLTVADLADIKTGSADLKTVLVEISSSAGGAGYTRGEVESGTMTLYGKEGEAELTVDVSPDTLGVVALGEQRIPTEVAAQILNNLGLTGNGYMIINPNYGMRVDGNGKLVADATDGNLTLSGFQDVADNMFKCRYESNADVKAFDGSPLTSINGKNAFERAFCGCNSLKDANLSGVKNVRGENAMGQMFMDSKLTACDMSELTAVDGTNCMTSAFCNAPLEKLDLKNLQYINGTNTMKDCIVKTNLTSMSFPELTSINGSSQAAYQMVNGNSKLKHVDFPKLETMNSNAAYRMVTNNANLTSISMPNLTSVAGTTSTNCGHQFRDNSNLLSVDLHSLKDVGYYGLQYAFYGLPKIQKTVYPNVDTVGTNAFYQAYYNSSVSSVSFPKLSSTNAGSFRDAFSNARNLAEVNFPELVVVNGDSALAGAFESSSLSTISFPKMTKTNGTYSFMNAFRNCKNLISVDFPVLSEIKSGVYGQVFYSIFNGCTNLTAVNFNDIECQYDQMMHYAFQNCTSLSSITLPVHTPYNSNVFYRMFYGCTNLTSVTFNKLEYTNYANFRETFSGCTKLEEVNFPELTCLYADYSFENAFNYCTSLKRVNFPKLMYIGDTNVVSYQDLQFRQAFQTCAPDIVLKFPALIQIKQANNSGYDTFYNCTKLKAIYFKSLKSIVGINGNMTDTGAKFLFTGCSTLTDLYFNIAVKDYIESHPGYPTLWGRGAGNATVHFLEENDPAWDE